MREEVSPAYGKTYGFHREPSPREERGTDHRESLEVRAKLLTFKGAELDASSSSYPSYLEGLRVEISLEPRNSRSTWERQ